jgi:hypothetical protein
MRRDGAGTSHRDGAGRSHGAPSHRVSIRARAATACGSADRIAPAARRWAMGRRGEGISGGTKDATSAVAIASRDRSRRNMPRDSPRSGSSRGRPRAQAPRPSGPRRTGRDARRIGQPGPAAIVFEQARSQGGRATAPVVGASASRSGRSDRALQMRCSRAGDRGGPPTPGHSPDAGHYRRNRHRRSRDLTASLAAPTDLFAVWPGRGGFDPVSRHRVALRRRRGAQHPQQPLGDFLIEKVVCQLPERLVELGIGFGSRPRPQRIVRSSTVRQRAVSRFYFAREKRFRGHLMPLVALSQGSRPGAGTFGGCLVPGRATAYDNARWLDGFPVH